MLLEENPWILLELCTNHFYDFLYGNEKNDVIDTIFADGNSIKCIWRNVQQLFRKTELYETRTAAGKSVYKIDVNGITDFGNSMIDLFQKRKMIPDAWEMLYLSNKIPPVEKEGVYRITAESLQESETVGGEFMIERLVSNPFFASMDISNLRLQICEMDPMLQVILRYKQCGVIFTELHKGVCLKRFCWKPK